MDYNKRIDELILKYNKINYLYIYQNKTNSSFNDDVNTQERLKKITDLVYYQDWNKLHIIQKKIKIEEFIDNLIANNTSSNLEDIKKELITKLEEKKITKKHIQYDILNGKILDILCLNKQENTFFLE